MKEYEIKLRAVIAWCHSCEWSVVDFAMLFRRMQLVIDYHLQWWQAKTPETTALAKWSREDAADELNRFMRARCFPLEIRDAVRWLIQDHMKKIPSR